MGRKTHQPARHKPGKKSWDTGEPLGETPYTDRLKLEEITKKFLTLLTIELMISDYEDA